MSDDITVQYFFTYPSHVLRLQGGVRMKAEITASNWPDTMSVLQCKDSAAICVTNNSVMLCAIFAFSSSQCAFNAILAGSPRDGLQLARHSIHAATQGQPGAAAGAPGA